MHNIKYHRMQQPNGEEEKNYKQLQSTLHIYSVYELDGRYLKVTCMQRLCTLYSVQYTRRPIMYNVPWNVILTLLLLWIGGIFLK